MHAKRTSPRLSTQRKLELFAGYLSTLMRSPAPDRFGVGTFENDGSKIRTIQIEIRKTTGCGEDPVWDSVFIDREWCGNRCGGAQKLAELFAGYFDE